MKKQLYHIAENNGGALPASEPSVNPSPKYKIDDVVFFLDGKIYSDKICGISTFIGSIKNMTSGGSTTSQKGGIVSYHTENGRKIDESDCFETKKQLIDTLEEVKLPF